MRKRLYKHAALAALAFAALTAFSATARAQGAEGEVRAAMQQVFSRLQTGDYGGVYDALPAASQKRVTREKFVEALGRVRDAFTLNGLEIERVRVAGDIGVVDATVYASLHRPAEAEGKIVSRQYVVREGGTWRITTGDRSTVRPLLAANPAFARQYPPTEPRVYFKRDGRWVSLDTLNGSRRRK
jgi:hypothetical protein